MRVVIDTNILVSACWKPDGLEAQVIDLAIAGKITVCVSPAILNEYRDVLSRPKLASVSARAIELLSALQRAAFAVETTTPLDLSPDDDDNRFLEYAEAAGAAWLVTGNLRHYPALHGVTQVVNSRTFLTLPHPSVPLK